MDEEKLEDHDVEGSVSQGASFIFNGEPDEGTRKVFNCCCAEALARFVFHKDCVQQPLANGFPQSLLCTYRQDPHWTYPP